MSKILTGRILNLKMQKTVVVEIDTTYTHPLYKKTLKRTKKVKAHYDGTDLKIGDKVTIQETKPISKTKNWIIIKS